VAIRVKQKVERLLRKRGLLQPDGADEAQAEATLWEKLCAAAVQGRIALGPKAGWRVTRLGGHPVLLPPGPRHLCADSDGFNLHAHTHVGAGKRDELERLCRYILRPALCGKRIALTDKGEVLFALKRPWSDGTSHLLFQPLEFLEKLVAIVPPPHRHLVTYHGVVSSAASFRAEIIPRGAEPDPAADAADAGSSPELPPVRPRRLPFAQLLFRTFEIDPLRCPRCDGKLKVLAVLTDPIEVARLCQHLGEPTEPPKLWPSRFVVQTSWEFAQPP
jgi:hypothetical protein